MNDTTSNGLCLKKDMSHCSQWYFEHIDRWTRCECNEVIE